MNNYEYIVDAFTKEEDKTNLEVDHLDVSCITSKNNNFELDSAGNLTVKSLNVEEVSLASQFLLNFVYPVGSIYISTSSTSPSNLFGGVWEQVKDRFLLAAGDTYQADETGGEASHTLTVEEIPSHNHKVGYGGSNLGPSNEPYYDHWPITYLPNNFFLPTQATGGGKSHNNMPPYITVYMWKRVQ